MIKWKATTFIWAGSPAVSRVGVDRETNQCLVFANGKRVFKVGSDTSYFDTFEEAKRWVVNRFQREVDSYRASLKWAEEKLADASALTPPDE